MIFWFAGASKQNYVTILLDVYCLFQFEATKELKDAIWQNWLVNLTGELGKYIPDDLMQEHHNKCHEDMVPKHGGSFNDPFFRETISPNVHFFLRLKEEMERAFELKSHSKTHTSRPVTDEIRALMDMYRHEKVHYFCSGRSMGHAAADVVDDGYTTLAKGKLADFLQNSTERAEVFAMLRRHRRQEPTPESPAPTTLNLNSCDDDSDYSSDDGVERAIEGSGWVFHMDAETRDNAPFNHEETNDDDEEMDDERSFDRDVDVEGWSEENGVLADME